MQKDEHAKPKDDNDEREKRRSLPTNKEGKIERYNNQTETKKDWRTNGREPTVEH
jgi:hypothetical protein